MIVQRIVSAVCVACLVAYFVERLGLAELPGIATDYFALGMFALGLVILGRRTRDVKESGGVIG